MDRIFTVHSRSHCHYWDCKPESSQCLRFQETPASKDVRHINVCVDDPQEYAPLIDAAVDEPVVANNLVGIYVLQTFASENEQNGEIYHIDLFDSLRALVYQDGLGMPARWVHTDVDQPLVLTTL